MTRVTAFSSPLLLGFDQIERAFDRLSKVADGYPPYNIERLAADGERGERLRITLAVAGFSSEELDVTVEDSELVIRGRRAEEDGSRDFLHRGIATRQFRRSFVLADGIEVIAADLADGLLSIDLARPPNGKGVRRIEITGRGEAGPKEYE